MTHYEDRKHMKKKVQVTTTTHDGNITASDNNLFSWKIGTSIYEAHPFFYLITGLLETADLNNNEFSFPCIHLEQDETKRICDINITINATEIIIILFDYTVKYHEVNEIAQQKNESVLKSKELKLKNEYLLKKEEFKNSFIANINHEIRTPLTGILGFIEVLEKTKLSFEQEELAKIIKRESLHLTALIDDMLDISKIEAGKLKITEERFAFHDLIKGFETSYSKIAEENGILFKTSIDPNIQEYLIGDSTRVYQILNNILNNAFKFTEQGTIKLTISKNYQRTDKLSINFKIEDTGAGISEADIPHLFDRFTRFNEDKTTTGTGLGLAIAKNLADLLHGEIKVTSKPKKGTTFNIKLPFKFEVRKSAPEKKRKKYTLPTTKQKFRILLVEDEEVTQYLVMKILISHGSFFVDIAINGQEAINYIEKRNYDLILMDLKLSLLDGYKATHMIRNNYGDAIISEIPIIGFTARGNETEREKCLRSGMDDFLAKPFEQEDLIYKIIKQIAKKATS